jgi:hypothetical protein
MKNKDKETLEIESDTLLIVPKNRDLIKNPIYFLIENSNDKYRLVRNEKMKKLILVKEKPHG